jgi:hypothetical protein
MKSSRYLSRFLALGVFVLSAASGFATERRFAVSYEATTSPAGTIEYEQHVLWEHGKGFDSLKFRQEVEFGITDRFQLSAYLYDFGYDREDGHGKTTWKGSGLEAIYQLTDPNKSFIGSAIYGEAIMNDKELELEAKLILQKNFGPLTLVYNGIVEAHWEDGYKNTVGVLEQTIGLSYQLRPSFSVGVEAKHEVTFENWEHSGGNAVFVGPNVSFRKGGFFATVAGLFRASNVSGEPQIEVSTIMGFHF